MAASQSKTSPEHKRIRSYHTSLPFREVGQDFTHNSVFKKGTYEHKVGPFIQAIGRILGKGGENLNE